MQLHILSAASLGMAFNVVFLPIQPVVVVVGLLVVVVIKTVAEVAATEISTE